MWISFTEFPTLNYKMHRHTTDVYTYIWTHPSIISGFPNSVSLRLFVFTHMLSHLCKIYFVKLYQQVSLLYICKLKIFNNSRWLLNNIIDNSSVPNTKTRVIFHWHTFHTHLKTTKPTVTTDWPRPRSSSSAMAMDETRTRWGISVCVRVCVSFITTITTNCVANSLGIQCLSLLFLCLFVSLVLWPSLALPTWGVFWPYLCFMALVLINGRTNLSNDSVWIWWSGVNIGSVCSASIFDFDRQWSINRSRSLWICALLIQQNILLVFGKYIYKKYTYTNTQKHQNIKPISHPVIMSKPHPSTVRVPIVSVSEQPTQTACNRRHRPATIDADIVQNNDKYRDHISEITFDSGFQSGSIEFSTGDASDYAVPCVPVSTVNAATLVAKAQQSTSTKSSSSSSSASSLKTTSSSSASSKASTAIGASPSRAAANSQSVTIGSRSYVVDSDLREKNRQAYQRSAALTVKSDEADADTYSDDDDDASSEDSSVNSVEGNHNRYKMHVDKKSAAKEWSCSGPIDSSDSERNDLTTITGPLSHDPTGGKRWRITNPSILSKYMSMWRSCYIQDEDGET